MTATTDPRRTDEWFATFSASLREKYPRAVIRVGNNARGEKVIGRYSVIRQRWGTDLRNRKTVYRLEATY